MERILKECKDSHAGIITEGPHIHRRRHFSHEEPLSLKASEFTLGSATATAEEEIPYVSAVTGRRAADITR